MNNQIEQFLAAKKFAVAGASADRNKYGNRILRCYQMHGLDVLPINPKEAIIEGLPCVASVAALPDGIESLSVITPPAVTEQVVEQAIARGIRNVWMQPGAESPAAVARCRESGINVIADGSCLLVVLGYREH